MGILVIFAESGTSVAPVLERVASHHSGCSHGPMERNNIFGFFGARQAN